ncbi:MAG TPA: hypothetical protein VNI20_13905 [Fimbriimonadaceae bacterium]|nr:hypothetical protein [Fimbriimonadaceae bacterium]
MKDPSVIVLVRFKSELSIEEIWRVAEERAPQFRAFGGLTQKYYLQDPQSGEIAGLYLWSSKEDFLAFQETELKKTIPLAYKVVGQPRVEVYDVVFPLRD